MLNKNTLSKLIANGEGLQLDFKFNVTSSRKIAKSIVAFANSVGGTLLIGVKDNGKIVGVDPDEELYMLEDAVNSFVKPTPAYQVENIMVDRKVVLAMHINQGLNKPYYLNDEDKKWRCYLRQGDENIAANAVWMEVQKRQQLKISAHTSITKAEQILLSYLKDNEMITQSTFCKIANIPYKKATQYLVNLICLNVISLHITKNKNFYTLST